MTGTSSTHLPELVADSTALRHFTLTGHVGVLVPLMGGRIRVPREVFDPDEQPDAIVWSEIGNTLRHVEGMRYEHDDKAEHVQRLRGLRTNASIEIVDLTEDELVEAARLSGRDFARQMGITRLGKGEAAVMSVATNRRWSPVIDDGVARRVFETLEPGLEVYTCQTLLRMGTGVVRLPSGDELTSPEAEIIYRDLLAGGFRGPESLWDG